MFQPEICFAVAMALLVCSTTGEIDDSQCHDLYEYDASVKGTVSSPFYGKRQYHNGLWCEYRIRSPEGTRIKITFKDFDVKPPGHLIVSGKNEGAFHRLEGSEIPKPIISNEGENELRLLFITVTTGRGFLLEYESGPDLQYCEPGYLECTNHNCYRPDQKCNKVDECGDGSDEEGCEYCEPGYFECANHNCYTLEQKCDLVDDCGDGTDEEGCAGDIDDYQCHDLYEYDASVKGTVSSPFYGKRQYHNGLWCEYRIRSPEGTRIKITFKDFDLDPPDMLYVYGKNKQSVFGKFMGFENPRPIVSNEGENEIRLLFRTDFMAAGRGFLMEYESSPNMELCDPGYLECGNRNCYKPDQKCNGVDECGDGTDEENCNIPVILQPEECGVQAFLPKTIYDNDRMVGGEAAIPNSWPWQVSLQTRGSEPNGHFCGGSLINNQWVLTASHCVVGRPDPGDIKIVLGAHGKYTKTPYEQVRYSGRVISYPDLQGESIRRYDMTHDISLIKLNAPVTFNKGVQPACLPELGWAAQPGWHCYATGWGESRGSGGSEALKQTEQIVQPRSNCSFNEQTQICVHKSQSSACHGDSGGPLQCKIDGKWFVFGAASFVTTSNFLSGLCTGPGAMTVYSNSADKADWIKSMVKTYS